MITVNYYAGAADAAGRDTTEVDPGGVLTADGLLGLLGSDNPELAGVLGACSLLVEGRPVAGDELIPADARVDVLPPFAGG